MRNFSKIITAGAFAVLAFTTPSLADPVDTGIGDPAKACASYGLQPGSEGFKGCVDALSGQDSTPDANQSADAMMAQIRAQIDADNAAMQKQMDADFYAAEHPADGSPTKCVTTTNGTNTSTICP